MMEGSVLPEPRPQPAGYGLTKRITIARQAMQAALIVLGVALITFVLYLYVLPNSQIDAAKMQIVELQQQKAALERQNAALLQAIARNSDIKTLEERAKKLGMAPAAKSIYLTFPDTGATPAPQANAKQHASSTSTGQGNWREALSRERLQDGLREFRLTISQAVDSLLQHLRRD